MNDTATLDLFLPQRPSSGTQQAELLDALRRGERLTVLTALEKYRVFALSQRMGELRRMGWTVQSRMVDVPSGKRVAEYWMDGV